ncbi:bcl-2-related ovarian killer protein homolog A isoform X2 [Condylostylus longicornis]|uniref:bcl-2-related ovarian killer protein homolog A isoform X2 n=1 Tax=Condylostylus longicornis TaxID=2530218 RepID=UPI00244DCB91|nr:bcl-2-related ovarian killer protein homolog A isoform X2 [Condylostylus longicornis]
MSNLQLLSNSSDPNFQKDRNSSPLQRRRKFSFPATLHATTLLDVGTAISARRRLSNVSDAVSRKLSYTIGWKQSQISVQEITAQGKCLCGQYIRRRLKRSGLYNRKLGFQRIRSIIGTAMVNPTVKDIFPAVSILGDELERLHPRVYTGVTRQISRSAEIESPEAITILLSGLAVDCVRQGHSDYLPSLVQGVSDVIEDELVTWINDNGGWNGLNTHVYPENNEFSTFEWTTLTFGCIVALIILVIIIRFIFNVYLIPNYYNKI